MDETKTTQLTKVLPGQQTAQQTAQAQAQVVKDSIKAFSLTPEEGFTEMNPHSMLFDHTLISSDSSLLNLDVETLWLYQHQEKDYQEVNKQYTKHFLINVEKT